MKKIVKKKVFVGMSGGVDSSVSAALLKKQGYDVTGVFIKTWSPEWLTRLYDGQACTWQTERHDAMRVAAKLKIPLITLDLEKKYKRGVVDYMIAEYRAGRVPNPDVMCNKVVKFGGFFDFAMNHGADFVATGHYTRTSASKAPPPTTDSLVSPAETNYLHSRPAVSFGVQARQACESLLSGVFTSLLKSKDQDKDQTYFLWTLTQRGLSKTIFPVGGLLKPEVRKLAKKFNLPNAEKKDSQGLCFMGKIDVKEFLKHYIKEKAGDVLNSQGEVVGSHDGATFYTIGERHGFKINKKSPNDKPYYVVGKDIKKNIIVVSSEPDLADTARTEIVIDQVNWNQGMEPDVAKKYQARIRYRQELQEVEIMAKETGKRGRGKVYMVKFSKPQSAVSEGQSLVIYDGDVCLGGGIIV